MNSKSKGNIGEIKVASEFIKRGCTVSFPFGDNSRYDLIVDIDGELKKVQIKYCNSKWKDSYICQCCSSKNHTTNKKLNTYKLDVDLIAFYIFELDECFIIPIDIIGNRTKIHLRNTMPKNNQTKDIMFTWDYTFDKYFNDLSLA